MGSFGRFVEPVGILAIFNAVGRVFWGKVSDVIDRPRAMMLMFLFQGMAFMMLAGIESQIAVFTAPACSVSWPPLRRWWSGRWRGDRPTSR